MEPDDLSCLRNARPLKALARASGTSRRASGWAGEKATRSGTPSSPPSREKVEERWSFDVRGWESTRPPRLARLARPACLVRLASKLQPKTQGFLA
jgi:hypothetical protein